VILRQLRLDRKRLVELHRGLTVIAGFNDRTRSAIATAVAKEVTEALRGEGASLDVVVRPDDLPQVPPATAGGVASAAEGAAVDDAAARERAAESEVEAARRQLDGQARDALATADTALAGAETVVEELRSRLARLTQSAGKAGEAATALQNQRAALEVRRAEAEAELAEARRVAPEAVQDALAAYRRLQSVKPRPSPRAVTLADRWAAYTARQRGELPESEPPPEYLVAPARAALDAARAAVAEAEQAGEVRIEVDLAAVEDLERAHRHLLEAEQRANLRPSRLNRRRLDAAHQAERQALVKLGVSGYGDYLQRIVPAVRAGSATRSLEAAREALLDAEAVWEELHGGVPPMSDEDVSAALAGIRQEGVELLGDDPGDAFEERLRSHLENVVDVEWARDDLEAALDRVGVTTPGDLEALAEDWLEGAADRWRRILELEAQVDAVEKELAALPPPPPDAAPVDGGDVVARVRAELDAAGGALDEARRAQTAAAERVRRAEVAEQRVTDLSVRLSEATAAREAAERAAEPARAEAPPEASDVELRLYALARLAAHRGAPPSGPWPVVIEDAFAHVDAGARTAVHEVLVRAGSALQVIYLTGSDEIATWAEGLPPERGAVHRA
jgi:hypothetical protein